MKLPAIPIPYLIAGGAVAAALVYVAIKGAKGAGQAVGAGAVNLANGVASGTVIGLGDLVGIPQTSMTACDKARAAGDKWAMSFACPAKEFITSLFN